MQQFEINNSARDRVREYLSINKLSLEDAMHNEEHNQELAKILHAGLPAMVRLVYSQKKFIGFFWNKRDLLISFLAKKLSEAGGKRGKK